MKSCDSVSDNLVWPRSSVCWAEEGQDEYEDDGFIVSDVEEEEEQEEEEEDRDGAEERQKKKKRRKRLRFPFFFCPDYHLFYVVEAALWIETDSVFVLIGFH